MGGDSFNDIEKVVDQVVSPEWIMRWIVRFVLLFVLIGVDITVAKVSFHWTKKVEAATTDRDWFIQQQEAIEAAKLEEKAARKALERRQVDVAAQSGTFSVSYSDDRQITATLNQQILDAQRRRLSLIRDYNAHAGNVSDAAYLEGLPKRIELQDDGA